MMSAPELSAMQAQLRLDVRYFAFSMHESQAFYDPIYAAVDSDGIINAVAAATVEVYREAIA